MTHTDDAEVPVPVDPEPADERTDAEREADEAAGVTEPSA